MAFLLPDSFTQRRKDDSQAQEISNRDAAVVRLRRHQSITDVNECLDPHLVRQQLASQPIDVDVQAFRVEWFLASPGGSPELFRGNNTLDRTNESRDDKEFDARQIDRLSGAREVIIPVFNPQVPIVVHIIRRFQDLEIGQSFF